MKQPIMNRRYSPLSLRGHGSAHTVLLRMAEDEGRAARIGELKDRHPRLTWAKIAEEVGVTERAATQWRRTGALKPENAEALAEVFGVDFDYIWTGPRPDTPDLFVDRRAGSAAVEPQLARILERLEGVLDGIEQQLAGQTEVLRRIEARLGAEEGVRDELSDLIARHGRGIVQGLPPTSQPETKPKPPRSSTAATKRAKAHRTP